MKKVLPFIVLFIILSSVTMIISSCSKKVPLPNDKMDYTGVWISATQDTLIIRGDGSGDCKVANTSVKGGVVRFDPGNMLVIEQFGIGPKMKIISPPKTENEKWTMNLDGIIYTKQ